MSLKTTYMDGATGFIEKMDAVYEAGKAYVTSNLTALENALIQNAAKGLTTFDVILDVTFETSNLRLRGTHMNTFFNGIISALSDESIYNYECTLSLIDTDANTTRIKFSFNL